MGAPFIGFHLDEVARLMYQIMEPGEGVHYLWGIIER